MVEKATLLLIFFCCNPTSASCITIDTNNSSAFFLFASWSLPLQSLELIGYFLLSTAVVPLSTPSHLSHALPRFRLLSMMLKLELSWVAHQLVWKVCPPDLDVDLCDSSPFPRCLQGPGSFPLRLPTLALLPFTAATSLSLWSWWQPSCGSPSPHCWLLWCVAVFVGAPVSFGTILPGSSTIRLISSHYRGSSSNLAVPTLSTASPSMATMGPSPQSECVYFTLSPKWRKSILSQYVALSNQRHYDGSSLALRSRERYSAASVAVKNQRTRQGRQQPQSRCCSKKWWTGNGRGDKTH